MAIEISVEDPVRLAAVPPSLGGRASFLSPATLDGTFSALVGGINIYVSATDPVVGNAGGPGECSLGFTATYTPSGGGLAYPAIVTNSHCTQIWGAPDSTGLSQGASVPRAYFGYLQSTHTRRTARAIGAAWQMPRYSRSHQVV